MRIISGKHRGAKLFTLDGLDTRPTLDRVKEPLFSILTNEMQEAEVLDLFSGSGALGLEALSRGAKQVILCDKSTKAIHIIEQNVDKLKENLKVKVINKDYRKCLEQLSKENYKFDIIFLDPPYETDFSENACKLIVQYDLLNDEGIIVVETDRKSEVISNLNNIDLLEIYDERKYGRVNLIFLKQKR